MNNKTRDMVMTAIMAAVMCVLGPLSIPIGPVPISLTNFAIYIALYVLGTKRGTMAVLIYLLIGLAGVPVFSGFTSGPAKLAGPTGGYLIGYLPCALITGLGAGEKRPVWLLPVCMLVGTAALYIIGTAWFMIQTQNTLAASMGMCVLPFLPGDAVKIIAATLIAVPVRRTIANRT